MAPGVTLRKAYPLHGRADDAVAALASRDGLGRFLSAGSLAIRCQDQLPLFPQALAALEARLDDRELFKGIVAEGWDEHTATRCVERVTGAAYPLQRR